MELVLDHSSYEVNEAENSSSCCEHNMNTALFGFLHFGLNAHGVISPRPSLLVTVFPQVRFPLSRLPGQSGSIPSCGNAFLFCDIPGTTHNAKRKKPRCKTRAMMATRNDACRISFLHYWIDVRPLFDPAAVDAKAQILCLTASSPSPSNVKDRSHRYVQYWRSFLD